MHVHKQGRQEMVTDHELLTGRRRPSEKTWEEYSRDFQEV
jgi:hypothetical protein